MAPGLAEWPAVNHYTGKGNFRRAATQQQNLAEIYEVEIADQKRALEAYDVCLFSTSSHDMDTWRAKPLHTDATTDCRKLVRSRPRRSVSLPYQNDPTAPLTLTILPSSSLANKLYLKVADLAALESDYHKSTANYEKVARSSVSNNLMKWSVKDYFLKAGICHLATGDMVAVQRALESYRDLDPTFASTREHQLLVDLAEAVEAGDQEVFADKLFQFDQLSKLDKWKTTVLLRVKEGIEEKGEDFS